MSHANGDGRLRSRIVQLTEQRNGHARAAAEWKQEALKQLGRAEEMEKRARHAEMCATTAAEAAQESLARAERAEERALLCEGELLDIQGPYRRAAEAERGAAAELLYHARLAVMTLAPSPCPLTIPRGSWDAVVGMVRWLGSRPETEQLQLPIRLLAHAIVGMGHSESIQEARHYLDSCQELWRVREITEAAQARKEARDGGKS